MSLRQSPEWLAQQVRRTGRGYTVDGKRVNPGDVITEKAVGQDKPRTKKRGETMVEVSQPVITQMEYAPPVGNKQKNKTETRFEQTFLWPAKQSGELLSYQFERIKLILGDGRTYLPDFFGVWQNGVSQFWEIKGGYIHEDAAVKFDCACTQFPEFAFALCQWKQGEWRTLKKIRC